MSPAPTSSSPGPASAAVPSYAILRHPMFWVPTLYLAMGIPNATVSNASRIMYKNLGVPVETIVLYTGMMYLPWVLKPLWSPFLEPFKTKRFWVISMEFMMAVCAGLAAVALGMPNFFAVTIAIFWVMGFASGTQDIAADAVYMTSLPAKEQARYAGVQGMFWNAGAIFASGVLVIITDDLHEKLGLSWPQVWAVVLGIIATALTALGFWHYRVLPPGQPSALQGASMSDAFLSLKETWISFFKKKSIWMMLAVVFMYRFGEGFIEQLGPLFLIDEKANGGLGMSNSAWGTINGTLGTIGFITGALLGGFLAAKMTLRRSFIILALALNVPHVTYYLLSTLMPDSQIVIGAFVIIEKFGFGLGSVGHMLYMMQQVAPGPFKMSHYAFATGVMAFTKMATGTATKYVFEWLDKNYHSFFLFVLVASVPPVIFAWLAPFPVKDEEAQGGPAAGH
jgi:MFS transporter, PAT family, beta-lactamase induction signal transducer AmpG